jgi:hypothetical protein
VTTKDIIHLNEAQILQAMVDEADLPAAVREHLSGCEICGGEKKRFEGRIARMTLMARQAAPTPLRKPSLDRAEPRPVRWPSLGWRYGLPAGIALAATAIIVFGTLLTNSTQETTAYLMDRETIEDAQFMAEIARLEEDSFPALYLEISGSSEADAPKEPVDDGSSKGTETPEMDVPNSGNGKVS